MPPNNEDDSFNENTCVVCFKNVEIYSVGDCDHPVCYECSTRMRVLCRQNECPICRHDTQKVIFTKQVQPFKELDKSLGTRFLLDRKFKIVFESADLQNAYNKLLAHVCSKCPGRHAFQTFVNLRDHMRKEHELFYCDLCVENLKILTHERRCYTRKELATHRRQGDADNRSHRGHPLCEFCNERYMDNDELYRHLRRDHLFCHFCDADGLHHYYDSYDVLRRHFRDQHYLCEEGDCYEEKFTSAFRSEIDLKAHRASVHGRQMTKAAAKQARTLELEFTLKPRQRQFERRGGGGGGGVGRGSRYNNNCSDEEEGAVGGVAVDFHRGSRQSRPPAPSFSTTSNDEFPSLGGSGAPVMQHGLHFPKRGQGPGRGPLTDKDFPALGPDTGPTASVSLRVNSVSVGDRAQGSKPTNVSIHVNHRPSGMTATVSSSKNPRPQAKESFPSLPNTYSTISSKTTPQSAPAPAPQWSSKEPEAKLPVKTRPASSVIKPAQLKSYKLSNLEYNDFPMNDFPALSNNLPSHIASLASSQWSSGKEPESKFSTNKNKPTQPPPRPSQPKTFHIEDDFPSLNSRFDASCSFTPEPKRVEPKPPEVNKKKESSISISVDNDWAKVSKGANLENASSDSDVGSKKSNKKKKKKAKPKNESSSESLQTVSIKSVSNNNDSGKKNKQKEEPKSQAKQVKVEEKHKKTKSKEGKDNNKSSKSQETERKRSELTIDSLNDETSSENNINMNDFPSLSTSRLPPGFVNAVREKTPAPPGFEAPSNPPPGFSITLNSVARPNNGLTFTSSSGQHYPIPSSGDNGRVPLVFTYVPPPNVKHRNAALVSHVTGALRTTAGLDEFLHMSALFRQGALTADAYHSHCLEAMGNDAFMKIFPELLVLLPDIEKQQELWKVAPRSEWRLSVCAACGQVVMASDFKHHLATHSLENHFPVLSNGSAAHSNAWANK